MNVFERRQNKLKELLTEITAAELARKAKVAASTISRSLLDPTDPHHKNIGEVTARKLENGAHKEEGWLDGAGKTTQLETKQNFEHAGLQRPVRPVVVVGQAKLGDNGYYEEISSIAGSGDGTVAAYSADPEAYALRVKGDSMFPAIRDGWYVVVEPNGNPVIGEFVLVKLANGQRMVKELMMQTEQGITVLSVNGSTRRTIAREEIDNHHGIQPVVSIMSPSKWNPV